MTQKEPSSSNNLNESASTFSIIAYPFRDLYITLMQNGVNAEGLDTGDILNRIDQHRRKSQLPQAASD
jgi:hypothetical protein